MERVEAGFREAIQQWLDPDKGQQLFPTYRPRCCWTDRGPGGEPMAPPPLGPTRHDTTRPGGDGAVQFEDQSDEVAQEIEPALYRAGLGSAGGYPAQRYLAHPLLCSPDGVVRYLPDHMHEGWCEVPTKLRQRTSRLNGTDVREYPDYTRPNAPAGHVPAPLAPEVVATSQILPGTTRSSTASIPVQVRRPSASGSVRLRPGMVTAPARTGWWWTLPGTISSTST
jgi:hypothetical protein